MSSKWDRQVTSSSGVEAHVVEESRGEWEGLAFGGAPIGGEIGGEIGGGAIMTTVDLELGMGVQGGGGWGVAVAQPPPRERAGAGEPSDEPPPSRDHAGAEEASDDGSSGSSSDQGRAAVAVAAGVICAGASG